MGAIDDDITHEIQLEGGNTLTDNPADAGGRTIYGISEKANPDLWRNGPPSEAQARQRYLDRYVVQPGFNHIADRHLQAQLVDFGVTASPVVAIQKLQTAIGVTPDGVLGPQTLAAVIAADARVLNNKLAVARALMICRIVQAKPTQLTFLEGWIDRSLQFLV